MEETAYLLRNPCNARRLLQSIAQIDARQIVRKTIAELEAMAQRLSSFQTVAGMIICIGSTRTGNCSNASTS